MSKFTDFAEQVRDALNQADIRPVVEKGRGFQAVMVVVGEYEPDETVRDLPKGCSLNWDPELERWYIVPSEIQSGWQGDKEDVN